MARKSKLIQINDPDPKNRDKGKNFFITEMSASQAERWAMRAFMAMARSGVEIPPDVARSGMAGIMTIGLNALASGLSYEDAEPLLDEMFACVEYMPDIKHHPELKRRPFEEDIEEISTRLRLRSEVLNLHVDFSSAGAKS